MSIKKHNISNLLLVIFISITVIQLTVFQTYYEETKWQICNEIPSILEIAMKTNISKKIKKEFTYTPEHKNDPHDKNLGTYKEEIFRSQDTTFTYRSKIVTWEEKIDRGKQTYLQITNKLHPQDVKVIFDSLAIQKNIIAKSAIGIISTFYKEQNEWAGDTTQMSVDYRTSINKLGAFENISYHAYVEESFSTVWRLMPKLALCILLYLQIFTGIILIAWLQKRKKEKRKEIIRTKEGNYKMDNIIINPTTMKMNKEDVEISLTQQQNQLLLMFLQSENQQVSKEDILNKFWPNSYQSKSSMTTAIGRLKKNLADIGSERTIHTEKNLDYYELI
ncbi:helix-turn-helix domain-containing protein [uncultured Bacteroides sp.]|uniref:helix-turn-helix domain-containing protein n=1 Tax=uncultured Bacteroides sp. TaxID=162156 RepID=UPI002AAB246E|nr:helix-turn-helix domain-containing protein [uncultured Bacteroides sp.]